MNTLKTCLIASTLTLSTMAGLTACKPKNNAVRTTVIDPTAIGGPFTLTNQDGISVTQKDFLGKAQLVYFGFGFCPDVCPTSLQRMGAATDMLGRQAADIQPIFITIDPERDTPEALKLYLTANGFPKNMVGLTGTQAQIDDAAKQFRAYKKRVDDPQSAAGYTMDHTDLVYLMDKNGLFMDVFTHESTPADIADRVKAHLKTGK